MYVRRVRDFFDRRVKAIITKSSRADLLRMEQLIDSGVPLVEKVVSELRASCQGPSLYQTGTPVENELFDLPFSGFGLVVSIAICNDSPKTIHISGYRLEPLWPEVGFRWLDDPRKKAPRERSYSFPKYGPEGFEREYVLNHQVGRHGRLLADDCIEGFLCGVGQACIPDGYYHRQRLPIQLSVFDGRGQGTSIILNVLINREGRVRRRQRNEGLKKRDAETLGTRSRYGR